MRLMNIVAFVSAALWPALLPGPAAAQNDKVKMSINPQIYSFLPLFVAVDKGYFTEQKLDVEVTRYPGSAVTQIPILARGDLDVAPMVTGPAFFNQHNEGFGVKLVASVGHGRDGWNDTTWLMVSKEAWDSGAIKTLADLKGKRVDGGPDGSPVNLTAKQAILKAGLTLKDVEYGEKYRAVADVFPLFRNKAVDVLASVEPLVTRLEQEGLAKRWMASKDVMPWFQESYLAASAKFMKERPDVLRRYLIAFLKGAKDVHASGGKWTPELAQAVVKWTGFPIETINAIAGPQHVGQYGMIDKDSVSRQQEFWATEGKIRQKVTMDQIIDTTFIDAARKASGIQ